MIEINKLGLLRLGMANGWIWIGLIMDGLIMIYSFMIQLKFDNDMDHELTHDFTIKNLNYILIFIFNFNSTLLLNQTSKKIMWICLMKSMFKLAFFI